MERYPSQAIGDQGAEILERAGDDPERVAEAARRRGITVVQLLAAAIAEAVRRLVVEQSVADHRAGSSSV
jgi:hypothetical protein